LQNIILGYERSNSFLLFLIPTLFCWSFLLWCVLSILEIFLHMMAHHKNSLTMQKGIYFRSPLHVLSSHFCAICRYETDSKYNRTFDMLNKQMRIAHRSGALKEMAKAMGWNFQTIKQAITLTTLHFNGSKKTIIVSTFNNNKCTNISLRVPEPHYWIAFWLHTQFPGRIAREFRWVFVSFGWHWERRWTWHPCRQ